MFCSLKWLDMFRWRLETVVLLPEAGNESSQGMPEDSGEKKAVEVANESRQSAV